MGDVSAAIVPGIVLLILLYGLLRHVQVYDVFLAGAKQGLQTAVTVLPCLVAMLAMIAVLLQSGAMQALLRALAPLTRWMGIPEGALPVMLIRPFSGAAALAMLEQTMAQYGVDSAEAHVAAAMMGSSETIFYTVSLYLGVAKIRRARHAVPAALLAWLAGSVAAAWACAWCLR